MPALVSQGQLLDHQGGSPVLFQHLFWFFGHPEVYIVVLPAFGIISDLISVHARKNIFGYRMMVWAIVAIGGLSFIVWAHHMYVSGMNPYFGFFFATTTLIIAVPTALKVYNWVLTLWRGNIHLTVPMLFAIAFVFTFINGGLTGLFLGNVTVDLPLSDTMFVVAHFHMVMAVSPILAMFGAIYHWYPKITGRMLDDTLGKVHFWVTFIGTYAIYYPMHYLGILGVPRRYYAVENIDFIPQSAHSLNAGITIAALIVGAAQLVFLYNLIWSYFKGKPAGGNPWRATTLEWQTPDTPPKHGNFGPTLPVVYRWAYDYSVPGVERGLHPAECSAGQGALDSIGARRRYESRTGVLGGIDGRRRMVADQANHQRPALGRAGLRRRRSRRCSVPACGEDRPVGVSCRGRSPVHAVDCRLWRSDGVRGLAPRASGEAAVGEYVRADIGQRRVAMGAGFSTSWALGRHASRPACRRAP